MIACASFSHSIFVSSFAGIAALNVAKLVGYDYIRGDVIKTGVTALRFLAPCAKVKFALHLVLGGDYSPSSPREFAYHSHLLPSIFLAFILILFRVEFISSEDEEGETFFFFDSVGTFHVQNNYTYFA